MASQSAAHEIAPDVNDADADASEVAEQIEATAEMVESLEGEDAREFLATADDDDLADLRDALKSLEEAAETGRKKGAEKEMEQRAEARGVTSIGGKTLVTAHNKYTLADDDEILRTLRAVGADTDRVVSVNATDVAEVADENGLETDELVGQADYTYWR